MNINRVMSKAPIRASSHITLNTSEHVPFFHLECRRSTWLARSAAATGSRAARTRGEEPTEQSDRTRHDDARGEHGRKACELDRW
jgi:hypothetical protein